MKTIILIQWRAGTSEGSGADCLILAESTSAARQWVCAHALKNGWPTTRYTLTEREIIEQSHADGAMFEAQSEIGIN